MEAKRKRTKNIIIAAVLVAVAILMAALPAILSSGQKEENTGTAKSVAVQRGDIDSTVAGAGTLSGGDGVKITVPHGVEITEYLVANGDVVAEGQALATVDKTSVMNTIATVQNNLEYLAGEVRTAASGATNAYLAAPAAGRVKAIYANAGDDVQSVIREHGALMVVSLDGRMAVDAETASAAATPGKSVTIRCENGTEYAGRIEIRRGNTLTVTLTDNGPVLGAKADILLDGETVGTGTLYAHSAWNVTAAAGTVAGVNTAVERQITQGATVLTLRDVDAEGEYRRLSQLHRDYEDTMLKLFRLYQTGTVTASAAGRVSDLDTAHLGVMRNTGSYTAALLASPSEGVPEEYTVRPALLSEVTFGSMTFLAAPAAADVDLTVEPVVDTESAESIPVTSFDGVSVYDWDADASDWAASNPNRLAKGDLVYLVYDENGVLLWVVRPQKPEEPEFPDDSIIWGGGGGGGEAPAFEMYDRTETELMRISPMDTVSVQMLVDEMDILSVHTGQEAEITVDALPGRAFTGTVTAIDPNGKNNGGNSKYTVTITMPRAENMLDGMNAMAVLTVGTTENVLWLPAEALAEQGFKTVVYTGFDAKTGELTGPVEVVTGVSDGDKVEIVSGLEEGQTVWYIAYESAEAALFSGAAAPESA